MIVELLADIEHLNKVYGKEGMEHFTVELEVDSEYRKVATKELTYLDLDTKNKKLILKGE